METGPQLKFSSDRLVKPGIEPASPGLQGKWFIHYTTVAPLTHISLVSSFNWTMANSAEPDHSAASDQVLRHLLTECTLRI